LQGAVPKEHALDLKRPIIIVALLAIAGALLYLFVFRGPQAPENVLHLSGHIEATETDLSFQVPGNLASVGFEEGDEFKAGQVVAALDAKDLRDQVAVASAALGTAQANLAKLLAGSRPEEKREAKAAVDQAAADLENKRLDYGRSQQLLKEGVIPASRLDNSRAAFLVAQEALKRSQESWRLVMIGPRREDIDAARAEAKRAQANLGYARTRLAYATLVAPVNGTVLVKDAEPGETVSIGTPILTTANLDDVYFEGYIPETDLAKTRLGQRASITTDSFPGKGYPAEVRFIASRAEFTPKSVETHKERVTMVYRTKVYLLQNPGHQLRPGMPADAAIFLDTTRR
jgi:HlyD family secretion protein